MISVMDIEPERISSAAKIYEINPKSYLERLAQLN